MFLPDGGVAESLAGLTDEAVHVLGPGHWRSGDVGRSHFTVRALEYHDETGPLDASTLARYAAAVEQAAVGVGPVELVVRGVITSPGSVMAVASSPDGAADELRRRVAAELGPDGWLEDKHFPNGRDPVWYVSLVHFASRIEDPSALFRWLDGRAEADVGSALFRTASVCRWEMDGAGMRAVRLADIALV